MKKVGHLKTTYLRISEVFFYMYLTHYDKYKAVVVTEFLENLDKFPFEPVVKIDQPNKTERYKGIFSRMFSFRQLATEAKFYEEFKQQEIDVLHAHWGPLGLYALPMAKKLNVPLVTSFYGFDTSYNGLLDVMPHPYKRFTPLMTWYWKKGYKKLFAEGDYFTAFGERMIETLVKLGCPREKIMDGHSGITPQEREYSYTPIPKEGTINILMVNRFVEKKGVRYQIEALAKLMGDYPGLRIKMIGDGPLKEELYSLAKSLNVFDKIDWLGFRPYEEMITLMKECHIFTTPSVVSKQGDEEGGINTTVIDSLALGLPTIATEESGSQLIFHKETGLMAKPGDSDDLANQIRFLIESPGVVEKMAENGRRHIEKEFNQKVQTARLEQVYDDLITSRK